MSTDGNTAPPPRTMKASEFKAKCLKLMDEVSETGGEIVITKHGRPVSKLTPYVEKPKIPFGRHRDKIRVLGDIVSPMPADWFEKPDGEGDDLL